MYLFAAAVWKAQPFASTTQSPPVAVILPDVSAEDLESGMLFLLISSFNCLHVSNCSVLLNSTVLFR